MGIPGLLRTTVLLIAASTLVAAQDRRLPEIDRRALGNDTLAIELTAARYVLTIHPGRVHLDSMYALPETAPGFDARRYRPLVRSQQIIDSLGGALSNDIIHGATHIRMSEPRIQGEVATISITARVGPHPNSVGRTLIDYETIVITLHRDAGRWRLVTASQLGVS